jgi:glycosyltransferase involved in cell wall biosynthesis
VRTSNPDPAQTAGGPRLLCIGGEDHHLRIPFLQELSRAGWHVSAAGTGDPTPFARAGLCYHPIRFQRFISPLADRASVRQLRELLDRTGPDIVQSFDTKPNILVPRAARSHEGIRVVRTINGLGWVHSSRSPLALALRPVQRALHRSAANSTDQTVFQNRQDMEYFQRWGLAQPGCCELIPGSGIDIAGFDRALASGESPGQLRRQMRLGAARVVMTVTRLTRHKGVPTLLKAAELVHEARPDVRFVLVGPRESEGPMAVSAAELQRHAAYVVTTGQRGDVPALLRMADVFVFPTEYREGVPRALLEAALARLPIVATDMPGCNDVIIDGVSGRLVPARSPRNLAAAIVAQLDNPAAGRALGDRAAEFVRTHFALTQVVERYCQLYRSLLTRRTRAAVAVGQRETAASHCLP